MPVVDVFNPDEDVIFLVEQDANNPDKRYYDLTDISFSSTDNSINSTVTDLSVYEPGDRIYISGSAANDGGLLVKSATARKVLVDVAPDVGEYGELGLNTSVTTASAGATIDLWAIQTLRWTDCEDGFATNPRDVMGAVSYEPVLDDPGNFERFAYTDAVALGRGETSQGDVLLNNGDHHLDYLIYNDWGFDGQRTKIKVLRPTDSIADATLMAYMTAQGIAQSEDTVRVKIRDLDAIFDTPLVTQTYAGTNSGATGNEGTANDIKGNPKPICEGPFVYETPVTCNSSAPRYQIEHRGAIISVTNVYDGGSEILTSNYTVDYVNARVAPSASPARGITVTGLGFADIPTNGLILWLGADARETITDSGLEISAWRDKSASANNTSQGTAGNKPDYVASVASTGLPGVNFDGNDYMTLGSTVSLSGSRFAAVRTSGGTMQLNNAVLSTTRVGDGYTGHIFEVILYNRTLSADEIARVERYLNMKWGITVPDKNAYFSASETIRRIAINQYGRDWDLHFNQDYFNDMAADQPAAIRSGIIAQDTTGGDMFDFYMKSIGGGWSHNIEGKLEVYRLVDPNYVDPVQYFTDTEMESIEVEEITDSTNGLPVNQIKLGWGPIGTVQGAGELATGVSDTFRLFVAQKYRTVVSPSTPDIDIIRAHSLSQVLSKDTGIDNAVDGQAEADRLSGLYSLPRRLFRVTIIAPIFRVEVNDVVNIQTDDNDFGLVNGKNVVIMTLSIRIADNVTEFIAWG